jgi:hypothetical protein
MEMILDPSDGLSSQSSPTTENMFSGETFSSGNGEEIAVEPLENSSDGKDENCKHCQ